jgi:hypothetical protein
MTKKLRIDIDLPDDLDIQKFKFGFVINLTIGKLTAKLIRNKKPLLTPLHDKALMLKAEIIEE